MAEGPVSAVPVGSAGAVPASRYRHLLRHEQLVDAMSALSGQVLKPYLSSVLCIVAFFSSISFVFRAFHRADIAIGFHGAGLSNAYYMRPGGVVVEVVYDYDARSFYRIKANAFVVTISVSGISRWSASSLASPASSVFTTINIT